MLEVCIILRGFITKHKRLAAYLFFGAVTTMVNWCVYFPLHYVADLSAALSNCISWIIAVIFAFVTNKPFVYNSKDWSLRVTAPEFARFVACRLFSGCLETGLLLLFVDLLEMNGMLWKIFAGIIVICINYIGGKILVFKNS